MGAIREGLMEGISLHHDRRVCIGWGSVFRSHYRRSGVYLASQLQCESKKSPPPEGPDIFCFVTNGSEFLIDFYTPIIYTFLCTLDHKFLFNYLHNLYTHLRGTNNTVKSSSFRLLEMNQRYSSPLRSILLPAGLTGFVAI